MYLKHVFLLFFLLLISATNSFAETAFVDVTATIATAASVTSTSDLAFGTIIADPSGGEFTVDATGQSNTSNTPSTTYTVEAGTSSTATGVSSGLVEISIGASGVTVTVIYPADGAVLLSDIALIGVDMAVSDIVTNSAPNTFISGATGSHYIHVGGVLTIGKNQAAGDYSGTMEISLDYT